MSHSKLSLLIGIGVFSLFLILNFSHAQEGISNKELKAKFQDWSNKSVAKVAKDANPWHKELVAGLTQKAANNMYDLCVKSEGVDRSDCWQMMLRYGDRMVTQPVDYGYIFFLRKYNFLMTDQDRVWLLDYYATAPEDTKDWPYKWVQYVGLAGEEDQEKLPLVMNAFMLLDGVRHRSFAADAHLKLSVTESEYVEKADKFLSDYLADKGSLLLDEFLQGVGMEEQAAKGSHIFFLNCQRCHGPYGDGKGPQEFAHGKPLPRDFGRAEFKFKSVLMGTLPFDLDLIRTVTRGINKTPMPSFQNVLSLEEIGNVVQFVKTFSPRFSTEKPVLNEDVYPPPEDYLKRIQDEKEFDRETLKGKALYAKLGCWECHGPLGRGDGPSALNLEDRSQLFLAPPNDFSDGNVYKSGIEFKDIFRSIALGIEGTGMPEYQTDALLVQVTKADLTQPDNPSFPKFTDGELKQIASLFPKTDGLSKEEKIREGHIRRRALSLYVHHLNQSLSVDLRNWRRNRIVGITETTTAADRQSGEEFTIEKGTTGQILQVERIEDGTDSGKVFLLIRFFVDDKPIVVGFSEIPPKVPDDFLGRVTVKDLSIIKQEIPETPAER